MMHLAMKGYVESGGFVLRKETSVNNSELWSNVIMQSG